MFALITREPTWGLESRTFRKAVIHGWLSAASQTALTAIRDALPCTPAAEFR